MARNIEIKARIDSPADWEKRIGKIADAGPVVIRQDDTFFPSPHGRLKLRQFNPQQGELIFYQRPNSPGPKTSQYCISRTTEPDILRELLIQAFGSIGRVVKTRLLFLVGQTRIHLDEVQGLGHFLELEVVLEPRQTVEEGKAIATGLMAKLGIPSEALLNQAYVDLLSPPPA